MGPQLVFLLCSKEKYSHRQAQQQSCLPLRGETCYGNRCAQKGKIHTNLTTHHPTLSCISANEQLETISHLRKTKSNHERAKIAWSMLKRTKIYEKWKRNFKILISILPRGYFIHETRTRCYGWQSSEVPLEYLNLQIIDSIVPPLVWLFE